MYRINYENGGANIGNKIVEGLSALTTSLQEINDLLILQFTIVKPHVKEFFLIDTGLENPADFIN